MKVRLHSFLVKKMIQRWPLQRSYWQDAISDIIKIQVKIPNFFWQVEVRVKADKKIKEFEIELNLIDQWLEVQYSSVLYKDLESYVIQCLITNLNQTYLKAS